MPFQPMPVPPYGAKAKAANARKQAPRTLKGWLMRLIIWLVGLGFAVVLCAALAGALAAAIAYPNLPDISPLLDYQPKLPLEVYTSEGTLIEQFGNERRNLTPLKEIPKVLIDAVLSAEDSRFYAHHGIDYIGLARAGLANIRHPLSQGASTITMQVARNTYLTRERTMTRKLYEALLTFKLEHLLSKDQILEIYMNQIFLGNHAFGFAAAAQAYFGKDLKDITLAQAAMLAGLPKGPSTNNPITNPEKAQKRQQWVLDRMAELGYITHAQAEAAKLAPIEIKSAATVQLSRVHAQYVAEMVRQTILERYGPQAYTRGLKVYTTLRAADQEAAYDALRKGILNFESHQSYRGPEQFMQLSQSSDENDINIDDELTDHPDSGALLAAVVLSASSRQVTVQRPGGERIVISGDGLKYAQAGLTARMSSPLRIKPGSVVRITQMGPNGEKTPWRLTQLPEVQGALVAVDPRNGAIKALVGGFDYDLKKFNHVTQAWRQPGSSFKPFIYSAAMEKGFSPSSIVNDGPLHFDAASNGGVPWDPKNYEGSFEGPMTLRRALAKSKNMVSIRVLQAITPQYAQTWVTHFGFDAARQPAYLTMALGAGAVTPMQMAAAYCAFADGGYRVNPVLIERITDHTGKVLVAGQTTPPTEANRAISARNAFIMNTLLNEVARTGTAARAQSTLRRPDIYGKTGTTNDAMDAWFAGFQPTLVAIVWMGYDTPRSLGVKETGGGLSLPVWINFMQTALKDAPIAPLIVPTGVTEVAGNWYYNENSTGGGVTDLMDPGQTSVFGTLQPDGTPIAPTQDPAERNRILDQFRN